MHYLIGPLTSTQIIPLRLKQHSNSPKFIGNLKWNHLGIRTREQSGIPPITLRMRRIMNILGTCLKERNVICVTRDLLSATNPLWTGLTTILDTLDKMLNHVAYTVIDIKLIEMN
jgi:hypothetical protein